MLVSKVFLINLNLNLNLVYKSVGHVVDLLISKVSGTGPQKINYLKKKDHEILFLLNITAFQFNQLLET